MPNPGQPFDVNGVRYAYSDTKLVWWAGGNPFHNHQDLNLMKQARQKADTIIVNDWCWNALAKHADVVLPCTTRMERVDMALTTRDPFVVWVSKLTEPYGQARGDFDIFAGLGATMGVADSFTEGRSSAEWQHQISAQTLERADAAGIEMPDYNSFGKDGWFKLADPPRQMIMLDAFRADPVANPRATPSGKF